MILRIVTMIIIVKVIMMIIIPFIAYAMNLKTINYNNRYKKNKEIY